MAEILNDTPLTPEQRGYLDSLIRCAQSLLDLLNDVLDLSKIEAGRITLEQIPYNPCKVVESVGSVLGTRAAERGIELICRVSGDMPERIIGDPTRLRQILTNLATNAIKFTRKGEVMIVGGADEEQGGQVRMWFEVRDSGIGIHEEMLPRLFEKFTQLDGTTTRRYGGTGLGLAICKQLVELMGGSIDVESRVGVGSTFHVAFPAQVAAHQQPARPLPDLQGKCVMVVDDHPSSRAAVANMLRDFGCKVVPVRTGKAALDRFETEPPEVVFIDADMKDLEAVATMQGIRARSGGRDVPVVLMAAGTRRRDRTKARDVQASGFIQKPARRSALLGALGRALSQVKPPHAKCAEKTPAAVGTRSVSGARVLLVEDNSVNLEFMTVLLERAGYIVVPASTGEQAIAEADREAFDVILMDVQMPGMDGFSTTRVLRERSLAAHTPIIAVTAHTMKGDQQRCLDAGMDGYVAKPIDAGVLFEVMEAAMEKRRATTDPQRAPATPDEPPPVDLDRLAQDTDWSFAVAHVDRFLQRARALVRDAIDAAEHHDVESARRLAHQVRGGAIHMPALVEAATACMQAARNNDVAQLQEQLRVLLQRIDAAQIYYQARIAESTGPGSG
jgi:CheY-like chemotaxis protein